MNLSDNTPFVLVCSGFAIAVLALAVSSLREAAAMKRWPVAKGRVLSSKVEEYRADAGPGNFGGPRGRLLLYRPVVVYEYEVDGQRFHGDRIPKRPSESVLEPRVPRAWLLAVAIAVALLILAGYLY